MEFVCLADREAGARDGELDDEEEEEHHHVDEQDHLQNIRSVFISKMQELIHSS